MKLVGIICFFLDHKWSGFGKDVKTINNLKEQRKINFCIRCGARDLFK